MRIGFLVAGFPPYGNGGGDRSLRRGSGLVDSAPQPRRGRLLIDFARKYSEEYDHHGVVVLTVPAVKSGKVLPHRAVVENALRLPAKVDAWRNRGNRLDIVETSEYGDLGLHIDIRRVKLVARLHTGILELASARGMGWDPRVRSVFALERETVRRSHRVTALTQFQKNFATSVYGISSTKIGVAPNFINIPDEDCPTVINKKIGLFGTVGWIKGSNVLCEAFNRVSEQHPDASMLFVGRDALERFPLRKRSTISMCRSILRQPERVRFTGQLPRNEAIKEMRNTRIVVLPSRYEAFSMVLLEAMGFGKPVVSTTVCGIPEIVEDGRSGFLVQPNDPDELSSAICRLLEDDALCARMGRHGRRIVETRFSRDVVMKQMLEFYENIL